MDSIGPVEGSSPFPDQSILPKQELDAQSGQTRRELVQIFANPRPNETFLDMSNDTITFLEKHCPKAMQELDTFLQEEKESIRQLVQVGWKGLKAEMGSKMASPGPTGRSLEQVRGEIVSRVTNLCMEALKKTGIDSPGRYLAYGTPGWNSDIDAVYVASIDVPEKLQSVEKIMFDAIFFGKFGKSSGELLDTESYLTHPGASCRTESHLRTEEGRRLYSNLELTAAVLQLLMSHDPRSEEWKSLRDQLIQDAGPEVKVALSAILAQAELFAISMQEEIADLSATLEHPPEQILRMTYKAGVVLKLGEAMDQSYAELNRLEEMEAQDPTLLEEQTHIDNLDLLRLRIANLALLRTQFFDEGYNSQAAFNKVCNVLGGQIYERSAEDYRKTVRKMYEETPEEDQWKELALTRINTEKAQQIPSSNLQEAGSAMENLSMYRNHFKHALHGDETLASQQKALLSQSKYSERALGGALALLDDLKKRTSMTGDVAMDPASLEKLEELTENLTRAYRGASEMEKVKRQRVLNTTTTKLLLTSELLKANPGADPAKISASVDRALAKNEETLQNFQFEESLLPENLYLQMLPFVQDFVGITDANDAQGLPVLTNRRADAILRARCGLNSNPEVPRCHEESRQFTLAKHGFTTTTAIEQFNHDMGKLIMQVYDLSVFAGIVPAPAQEIPSSLLPDSLWQDVISLPEAVA